MNMARKPDIGNWRNTVVGLAAVALTLQGAIPAASAAAGPVTCRIELDRSVLPALDKPQSAVLKVSLLAPKTDQKKRPPVNLAIVLDRSGSMSANDKLEKAKLAAIEALHRLGPDDLFSLVIYNHNVETLIPAQSAANTDEIEARIRRIRSDGNTALFGGVSQAAAEIRKHLEDRYVHRILLLSDGLANVGPASPDELGRLGAALSKEGIAVTTVGVGTDYNEDLMTRLSGNSDGNAYFAAESRDLPGIFARELGDVLNVAATKVRLLIECADGIRPLRLVGRDGRIANNTIEVTLNQLYGGAEKFALVEVEVPPGTPDTGRLLASARVHYEDAVSLLPAVTTSSCTVRFSRDTTEVASSVNVDVRRKTTLNYNADAQAAAVAHGDRGELKEAAQALRDSARNLRQAASELKDASLVKKAEEVEQQADTLTTNGWNTRSRKTIVTDNYQIYNQQEPY